MILSLVPLTPAAAPPEPTARLRLHPRVSAADQAPRGGTIAAFRRRFLKEVQGLFVQVLVLAREMGMLQIGTVALDGTKIHIADIASRNGRQGDKYGERHPRHGTDPPHRG
jgi:hypothetical protein